MADIRDLGENVYLVNGKVIELRPGVADLSLDSDREWLGDLADNLYIHKFDKPVYGRYTGCTLLPVRVPSGRCSISKFDIRILPDAVKARLLEEAPEFADRV